MSFTLNVLAENRTIPHKIDGNVTPVVHQPGKPPEALRYRAQPELFDIQCKGIVKTVNGHTAWVNSMVVNEKQCPRNKHDIMSRKTPLSVDGSSYLPERRCKSYSRKCKSRWRRT